MKRPSSLRLFAALLGVVVLAAGSLAPDAAAQNGPLQVGDRAPAFPNPPPPPPGGAPRFGLTRQHRQAPGEQMQAIRMCSE